MVAIPGRFRRDAKPHFCVLASVDQRTTDQSRGQRDLLAPFVDLLLQLQAVGVAFCRPARSPPDIVIFAFPAVCEPRDLAVQNRDAVEIQAVAQ